MGPQYSYCRPGIWYHNTAIVGQGYGTTIQLLGSIVFISVRLLVNSNQTILYLINIERLYKMVIILLYEAKKG